MDFLTDTQWTPLFDDAHFGIMVLLSGTLTSSLVALLVAIPLGTIIAIYLSEFAPLTRARDRQAVARAAGRRADHRLRLLRAAVRHAAAADIYPDAAGLQLLSAGLVMGIMIIPYVASLSEDAMRAVPMSLREGSYAMGATRFQTAVNVVVPAAFSGIAAAYILGISRAVGETMILAVAAGMQPNLTFNPLEPAATITAYIVQVALGDLPHGIDRLPDHLRRGPDADADHAGLQHRSATACASDSGRRTDDGGDARQRSTARADRQAQSAGT